MSLAAKWYEPGFDRTVFRFYRQQRSASIVLVMASVFVPAAFLPGTSDDAANRSMDELVAFNRKSAKTHSGIWRDLAVRKRRTEVDAQLGWVVHFGQEHGLPTPITARLVDLIHELESGERELDRTNLAELHAVMPVAAPRLKVEAARSA